MNISWKTPKKTNLWMNLGVKITLFLVETPKSSCLQVSSLGETLPEFSVKKS